VIVSREDGFEQPLDKDAQGNVLSIPRIDIDGEDDVRQTPDKADAKPEVGEKEQPSPSPSPKSKDKWLSKHDDDTEKMKKLFAVFT
jgi:hypothetical protein